jgi:hypothetical protein
MASRTALSPLRDRPGPSPAVTATPAGAAFPDAGQAATPLFYGPSGMLMRPHHGGIHGYHPVDRRAAVPHPRGHTATSLPACAAGGIDRLAQLHLGTTVWAG